ncbi:nucleoside deaminase [Novosphingobium sp. 9]|uniref:nucleoside deaminase n=1 Tax=Novosphingobium sp. 9 TaxID=2025349 RepID=UPI0021B621EE|nr:nucleoside deaminase [Novosphingobium sp. 9]
MDETDERWMRRAVELATKIKGTSPADTPIAAVIVKDGVMLAACVNRTRETCDATAHAEILAFRSAGQTLGDMELRGATLYSTLQPCGMCTMAAIWAKVSRIVYGAGREDVHRMYFEDRHLDTLDFLADAWRRDLVIEGECLTQACAQLYYRPDDKVPLEEQGNI